MKRLLMLCCLVLSLLLIGGSLKVANAPKDMVSIVVDGEVVFNLPKVEQNNSLERAKIANQLIRNEINQKKSPQLQVIQGDDVAIIQIQGSKENLLMVTPQDVVNGENAFNQAQIWSYGLESYIDKATKSRAEVIFWPQMIWNVVSILFTLLLSLGLLSIFAKIPQQSHWWIYLTIGILWTSVITYSSSLSPQWRSWRYQLFQYLQQTQISEFSLLRLLLLFATLFVYSFLLHNLCKIYRRKLIKSLGLLLELLCHLFGWVVIAQFWGLELGLIMLGLGLMILAIAIRFSGSLVISMEKPFELGDLIEIDDLVGTVAKIGLNSTEIMTLAQTQVIIPNHYFLVGTFTNWSKGENGPIRLSIPIAVSRNTDIKKLKAAVLEGTKNHPDVLNSPRPFICFEKLGGDCLEFSLLFWTEAKDKQLQIISDLNYRIEANLQRYQIKLANSQQNVYLESPQIEQWFKAWLIQYGFNLSDTEIDRDDHD